MPSSHHSEAAITTEEIREAMVYMAYIVEKYGDVYAPILDRLEREYEAALSRETPKERARRILEQHAAKG